MDIALGRATHLSASAMDAAPARWSTPAVHRSLRVLVVLALYGITGVLIHGLITHTAARAVTAGDTSMCHRH